MMTQPINHSIYIVKTAVMDYLMTLNFAQDVEKIYLQLKKSLLNQYLKKLLKLRMKLLNVKVAVQN